MYQTSSGGKSTSDKIAPPFSLILIFLNMAISFVACQMHRDWVTTDHPSLNLFTGNLDIQLTNTLFLFAEIVTLSEGLCLTLQENSVE